jgi:hypothetical protein
MGVAGSSAADLWDKGNEEHRSMPVTNRTERFLLSADLEAIVQRAVWRYDLFMGQR